MSVNQAVEIARLDERGKRNEAGLDDVKALVDDLGDDVKEVKEVQNQSLIVLQKMETSLEHMTVKLGEHDKADVELIKSVRSLENAHAKVATKFKIVLGILSLIGTSMLGVAIKLLFFSPVLSGG